MQIKDKYRMTKEQNIFYAKRNIVDSIWKEANLEGLNVTFPDTQAIYEGINVPAMQVRDIVVINNLKHCWQFVIDTIDYPLSISYINQINQEVGSSGEVWNSGVFRTSPVNIGGTSWMPDIPEYENVKENLENIMNIDAPTERAVTMMLYLMRSQLYNDGNKRTAQIVANKIMIENGCGIISIPKEHISGFSKELIDFYETDDYESIMEYVYNNCITGMEPVKDISVDENCEEELEP